MADSSSSGSEAVSVPVPSSAAPSLPPCETIWVCNLPDKVKKGPLKDALYRLYSTFGSIKGINVTKTKALRGQAWISFSDVAQSATALRDTQGQLLFGKPIRVEYAKSKGDAVLKAQGVPLHEQNQERAKRKQEKAKEAEAASSSSSSSSSGVGTKRGRGTMGVTTGPAAKRQAVEGGAGGLPVPIVGNAVPVSAVPSKTLLASSLPADATEPLVKALFGRFPGFLELRLIQERGLAFITYSTEQEATAALMALNGFRLTNVHSLSVGYAATSAK